MAALLHSSLGDRARVRTCLKKIVRKEKKTYCVILFARMMTCEFQFGGSAFTKVINNHLYTAPYFNWTRTSISLQYLGAASASLNNTDNQFIRSYFSERSSVMTDLKTGL